MILLLVLNFIYASMFMLTKIGLQISTPIFMTGIRMVIGGVISLGIYAMVTKSSQEIYSITNIQWGLISMVALINVYSCNALEVAGLAYLPVGKTAFIYNLTPFMAAILAYFIFAERMTWQKWLGLSIGFLGFIPIFIAPSDIVDTTTRLGYLSLAELAVIGAAFSSVIGWTIMRLLLKQKKFSPFLLNGLSMLLGGLLCIGHAACFESQPFIQYGASGQFIKMVLIMAFFKHVIAYNLGAYLLIKYTTTLMAFFSFTASLFATILGIVFFNECISAYFIISICCVFIGLVIFYQQELQQGYIKK